MILHFLLISTPPPSSPPYPTTQPLFHPLFFSSFFAWRLALNVHHSAKNKRSELIGLSAAALVDPLIRPEKRRYTSEFCFNSSFRVLQSLHATVTSKVSPLPPSPNTFLGLGPVAMKTSAPHFIFFLCYLPAEEKERFCLGCALPRESSRHRCQGWVDSGPADVTNIAHAWPHPWPANAKSGWFSSKINLEPILRKTTTQKTRIRKWGRVPRRDRRCLVRSAFLRLCHNLEGQQQQWRLWPDERQDFSD